MPPAHKKAALRRTASLMRSGVALAQSDVACDAQEQDAFLIEYERKPSFVIESAHRSPQIAVPVSILNKFHSVYDTQNALEKQEK